MIDHPAVNRRITLASRPQGVPAPENFALTQAPVPRPGAGQLLVRNTWLGLAPAARLRMSEGGGYAESMKIGDVIYGQSVGVVVESGHPDFKAGDEVATINGGWQDYSVCDAQSVWRADLSRASAAAWLGILGTSGMTAWVGLTRVVRLEAGETLVVSAAAGAVGSVAGQIGKVLGCRVVGIARGAEKCRYVAEELGLDACVDYSASDFPDALARTCPDGVDVYYENVGGAVRAAVWPLMNRDGRVAVCGLISEYHGELNGGPDWMSILTKRLRVEGFILSDFAGLREAFIEEMGEWYSTGRIQAREDRSSGLESAPAAFIRMLTGGNLGKTVVRL